MTVPCVWQWRKCPVRKLLPNNDLPSRHYSEGKFFMLKPSSTITLTLSLSEMTINIFTKCSFLNHRFCKKNGLRKMSLLVFVYKSIFRLNFSHKNYKRIKYKLFFIITMKYNVLNKNLNFWIKFKCFSQNNGWGRGWVWPTKIEILVIS